MVTLIVLALYIMGVYTAYYQLQKWTSDSIKKDSEYDTLFALSLLSWIIYPVYGLVYLYKEYGGD